MEKKLLKDRTVIIDGDILIYKAAEAAMETLEVTCEEDEDFVYKTVYFGNKATAKELIESSIKHIKEATHSDKECIVISDATANFRKQINPEYKHNRKKTIKPALMEYLRDWFRNESGFNVYERPTLEADDVIGILATSEKIIKGDKCIYSYDKDFKTIPCKFAQGRPDGTIKKKIISESEADWWFMYQTLIGDVTDGYSGCPKVGSKKAEKLLGKIGEKTLAEMWQIVVEAFIKAGLTEEEAILNARMARILRNTDYDFKEKKVKLWQPPKNT